MLLLIKDLKKSLRSLIRHGNLFQIFYNRQTAYLIIAFGLCVISSYLNIILLTLNSFSDVSYRNSFTAFHVCELTTSNVY